MSDNGRPIRVIAVLALAIAFGVGLYHVLGSLRSSAALGASGTDPTQLNAMVNLPGTVVVAQGGSLYSLHGGRFTRLASGGWSQPTVTPDHQHVIAVRRQGLFSDLYELSLNGTVERQLTHNASSTVDQNHWSLYPRVSPDGSGLFYSYDRKYFAGSYLVDLSVYRMPLSGSQSQAAAWSTPNKGTGGDLEPIPTATGGILYSKFSIDGATNQVIAQLWYQRGRGTAGMALSPAGQRCQQPALAPGGAEVAMVCTEEGSSTSQLVVAPLDLGNLTLGPQTMLASGLPSAPTWSPDSKRLLYYAPTSGATGHFQLYAVTIPTKGAASPQAVTDTADFDSTSSPAWFQ